jgi:hypothetical protein
VSFYCLIEIFHNKEEEEFLFQIFLQVFFLVLSVFSKLSRHLPRNQKKTFRVDEGSQISRS